MDEYILFKFPNRFWDVAELIHVHDGRIIEAININKFYEVDSNWFYIYDTVGGQGTGYKKGELLRKICIAGCEFKSVLEEKS